MGLTFLRNTLLGMMALTLLDGKPVWVESSAVIIIREGYGQCADPGKATAIRVGPNALCVKETADAIRAKIKAAQ